MFANDLSGHCFAAAIRDTKTPKTKPWLIVKCVMKRFVIQAFLNDLFYFDLDKVSLIDKVETAWSYSRILFAR